MNDGKTDRSTKNINQTYRNQSETNSTAFKHFVIHAKTSRPSKDIQVSYEILVEI